MKKDVQTRIVLMSGVAMAIFVLALAGVFAGENDDQVPDTCNNNVCDDTDVFFCPSDCQFQPQPPAPTPTPTPPSPTPNPQPQPQPQPQPPAPSPSPTPSGERDVLKQPFASSSIWNRPIGSLAQSVPADIKPKGSPITADQDIISNAFSAPLTGVYVNTADWSGANRCSIQGGKMYDVPFPSGFVIPNSRENNGVAFLLADKRTYKQTQPVARCSAGSPITSHYNFPDSDIYGDGIRGAHGGSGMSVIGGALRTGELRKGSTIKHALKCNLNGNVDMSSDNNGFTFPAVKADSGYNQNGNYNYYGGDNPYVHMGSLLMLPEGEFNNLNFETEAGRIMATAFRDYGCYVVDNTGYDGNAIGVAWEADASGNLHRFEDEFDNEWGFEFESKGNGWSRDIQKIFTTAHVVTNNAANQVAAGGGLPRVPLAPEVSPP